MRDHSRRQRKPRTGGFPAGAFSEGWTTPPESVSRVLARTQREAANITDRGDGASADHPSRAGRAERQSTRKRGAHRSRQGAGDGAGNVPPSRQTGLPAERPTKAKDPDEGGGNRGRASEAGASSQAGSRPLPVRLDHGTGETGAASGGTLACADRDDRSTSARVGRDASPGPDRSVSRLPAGRSSGPCRSRRARQTDALRHRDRGSARPRTPHPPQAGWPCPRHGYRPDGLRLLLEPPRAGAESVPAGEGASPFGAGE